MVALSKVTKKDTDESVERMLKNWDIVRCHYCKKKISMLKARIINGGQYFVCKNGH